MSHNLLSAIGGRLRRRAIATPSSLYRRKPVSTAEVGPGPHREGDSSGIANLLFKMLQHVSIVAFTSAAVLGGTVAAADQSDMITEPVAVLQGLDKITARVSEIDAPVGKPVKFGTLQIMVRDCKKNPPEDRPEDAAFLEIDEIRPSEVNIRKFSGWMFAQSPALSSLEHPVYDVILLDCKGAAATANASGSPPPAPAPATASGNSRGNDGR